MYGRHRQDTSIRGPVVALHSISYLQTGRSVSRTSILRSDVRLLIPYGFGRREDGVYLFPTVRVIGGLLDIIVLCTLI